MAVEHVAWCIRDGQNIADVLANLCEPYRIERPHLQGKTWQDAIYACAIEWQPDAEVSVYAARRRRAA